ncbi:MAG: hotdog fold thioesterase [Saprospiraceae bacterium]
MIWKSKISIDELNNFTQNTLFSTLGMVIEKIGPDYVKGSMPVDARTKQPMGLLHGGASAAFAESLGSIASVLLFEKPEDYSIVGVDLHATHLNAVKDGMVIGIVKPIKLGKTMHFWQIEMTDELGKPICSSTLSILVRKTSN